MKQAAEKGATKKQPAAKKPAAASAAKTAAVKKAAPARPAGAKAVAAKAPARKPVPAAAPAKKPPSAATGVTKPKAAASPPPAASVPHATAKKELPMPAVAVAPVPVPIKKDPKLANNWKKKTADELSDAEVIAMPDDEYMNDKQMAFFRHKLVQLKNDILANAGQTTENLREDTVVVPDPADRATIEEEHALELRTRDRERKLLKKIEQSIARIDAGDYGYCDETGEPIGVGRLLARPTATLSLEAQQRRELKQKMFGD